VQRLCIVISLSVVGQQNVRFGSLADLSCNDRRMSASGGKADIDLPVSTDNLRLNGALMRQGSTVNKEGLTGKVGYEKRGCHWTKPDTKNEGVCPNLAH
jgi:hypothetical protein